VTVLSSISVPSRISSPADVVVLVAVLGGVAGEASNGRLSGTGNDSLGAWSGATDALWLREVQGIKMKRVVSMRVWPRSPAHLLEVVTLAVDLHRDAMAEIVRLELRVADQPSLTFPPFTLTPPRPQSAWRWRT
jgi:hypothetical protein